MISIKNTKLSKNSSSLIVSYLRDVQITCGNYPFVEDIYNFINTIKNNLSVELEKATNVYGGMTDWKFFVDHPLFNKFLHWFINQHQLTNSELRNFYDKKQVIDAWGNQLKKGHSVTCHMHDCFHGILYLTGGNPLILPELNIEIVPKPGDYYFFPPQIKHYVPEVNNDSERYSVIFNINEVKNWERNKKLNNLISDFSK